LREAGVLATVRGGFRKLTGRRIVDEFDRRNGTDTSGEESLWKFKIDSPSARFGRKYQPSTEQELAEAIRFLGVKPGEMNFIDLGCGKGRTLLVAASLGFQRVIGVEFADELAVTARKNLEKLEIANGAVIQGDAGEFHFPDADLVLYLYNPFSEEVMRKVVLNLRDCGAKKLFVIYKVPECTALLDWGGFLTRLGNPPGREYIQTWKLTSQMRSEEETPHPASLKTM
jgi:SAM-dependent methyltransferase